MHINVSMSTDPKLALVSASRYNCDIDYSYRDVCIKVSLGLKGVQKGTQVLKLNKGYLFIENQCISMCADLLPRN